MFKAKIKQSMEVDKHPSFEKYSHLPVTLKLYIAKEFYPELYTEIFDAVKELFMEVNDIDIVEDSIREREKRTGGCCASIIIQTC